MLVIIYVMSYRGFPTTAEELAADEQETKRLLAEKRAQLLGDAGAIIYAVVEMSDPRTLDKIEARLGREVFPDQIRDMGEEVLRVAAREASYALPPPPGPAPDAV